MSDNLDTIGKIIEDERDRDAVHIAIVPVKTYEKGLKPGQHVGFENDWNRKYVTDKPENGKLIGIVDPFLTKSPEEYTDTFWLFLYPGSITSLRHVWTHPAFQQDDSEKWLRELAAQCNIGYEHLIEMMDAHEVFIGVDTPDRGYMPNEYWKHYEIVTGKKVVDHNEAIFHCAC